MAHEENPPPQDRAGRYPAGDFARWLASTKRVPTLTEADREETAKGELRSLLANYAGGVLEWQKPRDAFLAMCIEQGLSKPHALIAYSLQAFSLAYAGIETAEDEDFGAELPPGSFWQQVTEAIREGKLDEFAAANWPD